MPNLHPQQAREKKFAQELADRLLGQALFGARSGLFLAESCHAIRPLLIAELRSRSVSIIALDLVIGSFDQMIRRAVDGEGALTLEHALRRFIEHTRKPLTLILSNAHRALTSEADLNVMFSLKSARDALWMEPPALPPALTGMPSFGLVLFGEESGLRFLLRRDQAFFGAELITGFA